MFIFNVAMLLLVTHLLQPGVENQQRPSSVASLTHLYNHKILRKELIDINGVVDSGLTKTVFAMESADTPSPPWHLVVRFRNGSKDLILTPGPDNEFVKNGVFIEGKNNTQIALHHISPCDWSLDGKNLLVSGREYDQPAQSIWCIDLKTMRGKPISRLLAEEYAYGAKFSPSSQEVAYVAGPIKRENKLRSTAYLDYGIFLYRSATGKTKRVANGLLVEWSPNGRRLLVATATQIWVMDKDGTHKKMIYPTSANRNRRFDSYPGLSFDNRAWEDYRSLGWLDDRHLLVEVIGKSSSTDVLILDDQGHILQTLPSVRLSKVWGAKKHLILAEKSSDGKYKVWNINY